MSELAVCLHWHEFGVSEVSWYMFTNSHVVHVSASLHSIQFEEHPTKYIMVKFRCILSLLVSFFFCCLISFGTTITNFYRRFNSLDIAPPHPTPLPHVLIHQLTRTASRIFIPVRSVDTLEAGHAIFTWRAVPWTLWEMKQTDMWMNNGFYAVDQDKW